MATGKKQDPSLQVAGTEDISLSSITSGQEAQIQKPDESAKVEEQRCWEGCKDPLPPPMPMTAEEWKAQERESMAWQMMLSLASGSSDWSPSSIAQQAFNFVDAYNVQCLIERGEEVVSAVDESSAKEQTHILTIEEVYETEDELSVAIEAGCVLRQQGGLPLADVLHISSANKKLVPTWNEGSFYQNGYGKFKIHWIN